MQVTLLVPHLFWPQAAGSDPYRDFDLPALARLFAHAAATRAVAGDADTWLCRAFGLPPERGCPAAPLTLTADGVDPGPDVWLRADPVHLAVMRDHLALADATRLDLSRAEADALVATLARHLQDDGLALFAPRPDRWYLRVPAFPDAGFTPLARVVGQPIGPHLPRGADAPHWQRLMTESQMLLHTHPVNAEREARGALPVNSLWLWGAGTRPVVSATPCDRLWSDDPLAAGLGHSAGVAVESRPRDFGALLEAAPDKRHLIVLDTLAAPARYGESDRWRHALAALEQDWFAPLGRALESRRIEAAALVATDGAHVQEWTLARGGWRHMWQRLWRRRAPLVRYAPHA